MYSFERGFSDNFREEPSSPTASHGVMLITGLAMTENFLFT
jgi:hypothetical protein